jgi:hypothetical protein
MKNLQVKRIQTFVTKRGKIIEKYSRSDSESLAFGISKHNSKAILATGGRGSSWR